MLGREMAATASTECESNVANSSALRLGRVERSAGHELLGSLFSRTTWERFGKSCARKKAVNVLTLAPVVMRRVVRDSFEEARIEQRGV